MANENDTVEMTDGDDTRDTTTDTPATREREPERRPPPARPMPEDPEELKAELTRAREAIARLNREDQAKRRRLEELDKAEEDKKAASLSELDRTRRAAQEADRKVAEERRLRESAEQALERERVNNAVEREALALGFVYPDIAPSLVDRQRITLDPETGKVEGVKSELERLLKLKPMLADGARGGGTPPRENPRRPGVPGVPAGRQAPDFVTETRSRGGYDF